MANDIPIAVKKRIIYAEDLFEPVDFTVLWIRGRGGGKTMAMYEQLFRKRVELAPTVDAVPVVRCKECSLEGTEGCPMVHRDPVFRTLYTEAKPDDFCSYGERRIDHG